MSDREILNLILNKIDTLNDRVDDLEKTVKRNSIITENTVNHCIKVLSEGQQLNAERLDRLDIDTLIQKTDTAITMVNLLNDKFELLKSQVTA